MADMTELFDDIVADIPRIAVRRRVWHLDEHIRGRARFLLQDSGLEWPGDWQMFACRQARGRAYYRSRVIVIPLFAIRRSPEFRDYYISHELAHVFAGQAANHGPAFMRWLKHICPPEALHHELPYKPRNAFAAGIRDTVKERQAAIRAERALDELIEPLANGLRCYLREKE